MTREEKFKRRNSSTCARRSLAVEINQDNVCVQIRKSCCKLVSLSVWLLQNFDTKFRSVNIQNIKPFHHHHHHYTCLCVYLNIYTKKEKFMLPLRRTRNPLQNRHTYTLQIRLRPRDTHRTIQQKNTTTTLKVPPDTISAASLLIDQYHTTNHLRHTTISETTTTSRL